MKILTFALFIFFLFSESHAQTNSTDIRNSAIIENSHNLTSDNNENPEIRIMPLGDSITKGSKSTDLSGYRRKLYLDLIHMGQNINFIGSKERGEPTDFDKDHEGHNSLCAISSDADLSLLSYVYAWLDNNSPDIILLHIGTNDVGSGENADKVIEDITDVLDEIDRWEADNSKVIKIFLAQIIMIVKEIETKGAIVAELNDKLVPLVEYRNNAGDNIILVDIESQLDYDNDMTDDGYHPNDSGYEKIADAWFNAIVNNTLSLDIKVILEGASIQDENLLMKTSLTDFLPDNQPFTLEPWFYEGSEEVLLGSSNTIQDFYAAHKIVDWLLVELRTSILSSSRIFRRSVFVNDQGWILDTDGSQGVKYGGISEGSYFIVLHNRNHLPIMSSAKIYLIP